MQNVENLTLQLDKNLVSEIKKISEIYHKNVSDLIKEGIELIINEKKKTLFYALNNAPESSEEEANEIMEQIKNLTEDDLRIVETKVLKIK